MSHTPADVASATRAMPARSVSLRLHHILIGGLLLLPVVIPLVFSPLYPDYNLPKRALTEMFVIALTLFWLTGMALRGRMVWIRTSFYLSMLAFLAINALSLFQAFNIAQGLDMLFQYTCLFMVPILVIHIVRTPRQIQALAIALAFTGGMVGLIGLLQYNGLLSLYTRGTYPISTIGNVTFVAEYYNVVFPIGLALVFCLRNIYFRLGAVLTCLFIAGHLVVLGSRGGWLGALVVAVIFTALYLIKYPHLRQNLRRAAIALIFLLTAWSVLSDLFSVDKTAEAQWERVFNRITSALTIKDDATRQRLYLWQDTFHLALAHPIAGIGVGNFEYNIPRYLSPESRAVKTRLEGFKKNELMAFRAHNEYLEIASETGLPGLLVFLWLLFQIAKTAWVQIRRYIQDTESVLAVGFAAALAATAVHALFSMNFQNPVSGLCFFLVVGLIWSQKGTQEEATQISRSISPSAVYQVVAVGIIALLAVFAVEIWTLVGSHYYQLGALWLKQHNNPRAEAAFTQSLAYRVPQPFLAYQGLGFAHYNQQHWTEAIDAFEKSLAIHPNNASVLIQLAQAQERAGRKREALASRQRAIDLNPSSVDLRLQQTRIFFQLGEFKRVEKELEQALIQAGPDDQSKIALAYLTYRNPDAAQSILQSLVGRYPNVAAYRTDLAMVLLKTGQRQEAQEQCKTTLEIDPKALNAYLIQGTILEQNLNLTAARDLYAQALVKLPRSTELQNRIHTLDLRLKSPISK